MYSLINFFPSLPPVTVPPTYVTEYCAPGQQPVDGGSVDEDSWAPAPICGDLVFSFLPVKDEPTYDSTTFIPAEPIVYSVATIASMTAFNQWGNLAAPELGDGFDTDEESEEPSPAVEAAGEGMDASALLSYEVLAKDESSDSDGDEVAGVDPDFLPQNYPSTHLRSYGTRSYHRELQTLLQPLESTLSFVKTDPGLAEPSSALPALVETPALSAGRPRGRPFKGTSKPKAASEPKAKSTKPKAPRKPNFDDLDFAPSGEAKFGGQSVVTNPLLFNNKFKPTFVTPSAVPTAQPVVAQADSMQVEAPAPKKTETPKAKPTRKPKAKSTRKPKASAVVAPSAAPIAAPAFVKAEEKKAELPVPLERIKHEPVVCTQVDLAVAEIMAQRTPAPEVKKSKPRRLDVPRHYKPRDKSGMPFPQFRDNVAPDWVREVMASENRAQDHEIIARFSEDYPSAKNFFTLNSMWAIRHGFTFVQYSGVVPAPRPAPKPRTAPYKRVPNFTAEKYNEIQHFLAENPRVGFATALERFGVQLRQWEYFEKHMDMVRSPRGFLNKLKAELGAFGDTIMAEANDNSLDEDSDSE